jgi:hypothetical protein
MLLCFLLLLGVGSSTACDVSYDFGNVSSAKATEMEVTLTWWQVTDMTKAGVFMATATGTACNSGYFGAQFHKNGKSSLLFSMWDAPKHQNNSEFVFQVNIPSVPPVIFTAPSVHAVTTWQSQLPA